MIVIRLNGDGVFSHIDLIFAKNRTCNYELSIESNNRHIRMGLNKEKEKRFYMEIYNCIYFDWEPFGKEITIVKKKYSSNLIDWRNKITHTIYNYDFRDEYSEIG